MNQVNTGKWFLLLTVAALVLTGTLTGCTRTEQSSVTTTERETAGNGTVYEERRVETTTSGAGKSERVTFDEVKDKSQQALEATAVFMTQERDRVTIEIRQMLSDLDRRIAELRARSGKASTEEKAGIEREIRDLEDEKAQLRQLREQAAQATGHAWIQVKEGWQKLQTRINERVQDRDQASGTSKR